MILRIPSLAFALLLALGVSSGAQVVISEFVAATSERRLQYDSDGVPHLGSGAEWYASGYTEVGWRDGTMPLGYGYASLGTDVSAAMVGKTPSLYLRKSFTATAGQAASGEVLQLVIDYDDAFIAYVNGREVARRNLGPTKAFAFADQPAYNTRASAGLTTISLGLASTFLVEGTNLVAIQAHDNGGNFLVNARLQIGGTTPVPLVAAGAPWRYFAGIVEPSGGVFDPSRLPQLGTGSQGTVWTTLTFGDGGWPSGAGPMGYDTTPDYQLGTNLIGMRNTAVALYIRRKFTTSATQRAGITAVNLRVDYDDAFVAFLNGTEIARANIGSPGQAPPYNQGADGSHPASRDDGGNNPAAILDIPVDPALLRTGENVLAVQIHNASAGSTDLLLDATLSASGTQALTLVNPTDTWRYFIGTQAPQEQAGGGSIVPEFSDWIELHNPGATAADLTGWSLTDNAGRPGKWRIPDGTEIAAGGYLVVLASGEDITAPAQGGMLHTNFGLSAQGEYLALVDPSGTVASAYAPGFPPQTYFHSYGLDPVSGQARYFEKATPGAPNATATRTALLPKPSFNLESGFHSGSLTVELATSAPGATIRYTLDGSEPTETNGKTYGGPFDPNSIFVGGAIGSINRDAWFGVPGNEVSAIPVNATPSYSDVLYKLETIPDWTDNYGNRLRGFLHPPATGAYTFWIAGDESGEFWLSTSADPADKQRVASFPSATAYHEYTRFPTQQSAPITLTAGQKYYLEVLHKEATGPDIISVAWQGPGVAQAVIGAAYISPAVPPTTGGGGPNAKKFNIVKARAFLSGAIPSPVATRTYLLNHDVRLQSIPSILLSGDEGRDLYLPNGALSLKGGQFVGSVWQAVNVDNDYNLALEEGRPFERSVTMELLVNGNQLAARTDIGIRIAGSPHARPNYTLSNLASTTWMSTWLNKPSMNFFFRDDLGLDTLDYPLFGANGVARFDDLRLRAGKNDPYDPFIRDELMRRLSLATGQPASRGIFCNLFVNGHYKAYFNLTERVRESFYQRSYNNDAEWDIWHIREIVEGDSAEYNTTLSYFRTNNMSVAANYAGAAARVNMASYIDYIIVNAYGATGDWPHNNYNLARPRVPGGKWVFSVWDAEGAFGAFGNNVNTNTFTASLAGSQAGESHMSRLVYLACKNSPEFRLLFADRIQKHFFGSGGLTQANILALYTGLRDTLNPAMTAARGSGISTGFFTSWWPTRRDILFGHFQGEGLWPATLAPGHSQQGSAITLTNPNSGGTIYYTLDGSDPRAPGGAAMGTAYANAIAIGTATRIRARVRSASGEWSPEQNLLFTNPELPRLVFSEIHYNPPGDDATEFVEILNAGPTAVDLTGLFFSDGVSFTFTGGTLAPGGRVVVVRDSVAFAAAYPGVAVAGQFTGALDNGGERVALSDLAGRVIFAVTYGDSGGWPTAADGDGHSLELVNADLPDDPASWRPSAFAGGTPGGKAASTINDWLASFFSGSLPGLLDDWDRDGSSEVLEYALGQRPDVPGILPVASTVVTVGGTDFLALRFRRYLPATDLTLTLEVSSDGQVWNTVQNPVRVGPAILNGDGTETVVWSSGISPGMTERVFLRLRASL